MPVPPDDFAETLARVLEPRDRSAVAEIITDATSLDDERLTVFLRLFADRVSDSAAPVTGRELRSMLLAARRSGAARRHEP